MLPTDLSNAMLLTALLLAFTHFATPIAYYSYLKIRWLHRPWNIKRDPGYRPRVTIVVPTYNEAKVIESKLDDIARQDYPKELVEVIVVDSASTDETPAKVEEWAHRNPSIKLVLVRELVRRGKAHALNHALKYATGDIVVITDADATWSSSNTLSNAMSWFSDPAIGAVTCLKIPAGKGLMSVEESYRELYNVVRLAESKKHSTPVFHGELAAFRRSLLERVGGFPTSIGADDSNTATRVALMGYRSIAVDNAWCTEKVPSREYYTWRIRRAQHLVQHFTKTMKWLLRAPGELKLVLLAETWLHLANPWLLLASTLLLLYLAITGSTTALILLALGALLLTLKLFRTWITTQTYLVIATLRNIQTKEIVWEKQEKE